MLRDLGTNRRHQKVRNFWTIPIQNYAGIIFEGGYLRSFMRGGDQLEKVTPDFSQKEWASQNCRDENRDRGASFKKRIKSKVGLSFEIGAFEVGGSMISCLLASGENKAKSPQNWWFFNFKRLVLRAPMEFLFHSFFKWKVSISTSTPPKMVAPLLLRKIWRNFFELIPPLMNDLK